MSDILSKLREIDETKIIYNIHRCRAGWGIIFYYHERSKGSDWRRGLSVERYYPTFEEMVESEWKIMNENRG